MGLFEEISLEWGGEKYSLLPDLELIARIENIITASELYEYVGRNAIPFAKVAMAYGIVLREAGASVRDADIYQGMFTSQKDQNNAASSVSVLLAMMAPSNPDDSENAKKKSE